MSHSNATGEQFLSKKQLAFIGLSSAQEVDAIHSAMLNGGFFAEVVVCDNGQFSTGSTSDVFGETVPCLSVDKSEIESEIVQMQQAYLLQIAEGERDEDDEWEGQLMRVVWHEDDTLSFYGDCDEFCQHELARKDVTECCGD